MREDINEGCGLIGEYDCFKGIELEPKVKDLIEIFIEAWQECKSTPHCAECKYWHKREKGSLLACLSERYAEKVIAAGYCKDAAPVWISVEDKLPEPFVQVLVYMPGEKPFPQVREGYIDKDGVWVSGYFKRESGEAKAWAKMPEPPKDFESIGQPKEKIK